MRIAVIGSGPSGLVSAKHCLSCLGNVKYLHIYERLPCLGGIWCGDKGHTVVYDNLRTNLPKEVMEFEGLSYEDDSIRTSFITPSVVNKYLINFAQIFKLEKYIMFNTNVTKVSRVGEEWMVTACNLQTNESKKENYDVVFVCNGHYSVPEVPRFPGLEKFKQNKDENAVIHTINYRTPVVYKGLKVLIIGAGPSGQDIAIDIASEAKQVYISHHCKELHFIQFPPNVFHKPDIEYFSDDRVTFIDGTSCLIDRVVLATGNECLKVRNFSACAL